MKSAEVDNGYNTAHIDFFGLEIAGKAVMLDLGRAAFDLAICELESELGAGGDHAAWRAFDDTTMPGQDMHITGYDGDFSVAASGSVQKVLCDRVATVTDMYQYTRDWAAVGATAGVPSAVLAGRRWDGKRGTVAGLAAAAAGAALASQVGRAIDDLGWLAPDATQAQGASGGPLWYEMNSTPIIVGVTGNVQRTGSRRGVSVGVPLGSKITSGACESMIREFIKSHP